MEICEARKQKVVSAEALELVARIQAKARRFVAARSPRPFAISQHSPISRSKSKGVEVSRSADRDPLVYKLTNMVNGRGYVGKATNSRCRMQQHRSGKNHGGKKYTNIQLVDRKIQEYGWDNFKVEWLETNVDPAKLLEREAYWMRKCDTLVPKGYNILGPGVEFPPMDDPTIRARAVASKRKRREGELSKMDPGQAEELRYRLEKQATRDRKRYNGEELPPDGRLLPSAKRQATWARKLEERLAKMSPEEAKKARAKHDSQKKYADANKEKLAAKNSAPKNQQYQQEWRDANKGRRPTLGRTAETSGWSAQGKGARK
jgi:group I intron endonuclease